MSRLTPEEKASYEKDGFLVRRGAFTREEIDELIEASEELCRDLAAAKGGTKMRVSPSDKDRCALLYTYQRAGNVTSLEHLRKTLAGRR